jgi:hypothetical protein
VFGNRGKDQQAACNVRSWPEIDLQFVLGEFLVTRILGHGICPRLSG